MPLLHTVTLALHVLFAAAWFGLGLALPAISRAALAGNAPDADRVVRLMTGSALLFYAFAVLNFVIGTSIGFEYGWPYHTALTLGLGIVAVQLLLIRPGWNALTADGESAERGRKKIQMGVGIGHLLWVITFILMYVGRGALGAPGSPLQP